MAAEPNDETDAEQEPDAGQEPGGDAPVEYDVTDDERTWGLLAHAAAFAGFVVPFGNILGPLLVWLIKKDESEFVDANGKQALNFQITWTILIVFAVLTLLIGVGLILVPVVALAWLVLVVLATVRASEGEVYDYPLTIELIS